jgi:two-component sensor histidine kinase
MNHRVKNLFAIVSGMITMTARSASSVQSMGEGLKGRLSALAKAHELIRPAISQDTHHQNSTLRFLLEEIMKPHSDAAAEPQLTFDGPEVQLGPNASTGLALIFHELATNAVKYGALSSQHGRIVTKGFGSTLARASATGQLGGSISFNWRPGGLHVDLKAPIERLQR